MMCDRCDRPILPGEKFETVDKFSSSSAAPTVYLHKTLCERPYPLPQTAPVDRETGRTI